MKDENDFRWCSLFLVLFGSSMIYIEKFFNYCKVNKILGIFGIMNR